MSNPVTGLASKADKNKSTKFKTIDINNVYKGSSVAPQKSTTAARQHGLQSLGKVASRRMPPPAHLPSLRSEHGGTDTGISLVPSGSSGWGSGTKEDEKTVTGVSVSSSQQPLQQVGRPLQSAAAAAQQTKVIESGASSGSGAAGAGQSWSSVTSGARGPGKLSIQKSRFQEEFPILAQGADEKTQQAQGKEDDGKELQYGPGPSLRPQNVASWREGGGRNLPQQPTDEERSTPTPPSTAPVAAASSEDDEPAQSAPSSFHPAAMMRMMRPGMGPPGPRLGPGGPMMYPHMMPPPFMFAGGRFPPQFAGFPPFFHPDPRFRGPPMPSRMGFDGPLDKPGSGKPFMERSAIIKDHALKEFDKLDPGDGSWATAADTDIDYSAKLVFSDEEEGTSCTARTVDKKAMSPRDRHSHRDRPANDREWSEEDAGEGREWMEDKDRPRDRKRPPPVDQENSAGSREPPLPPQFAQYGRPIPIDMHWQARMPFGPRGMPVMYPTRMPQGPLVREQIQPGYQRSDENLGPSEGGSRQARHLMQDDGADGGRHGRQFAAPDEEEISRRSDQDDNEDGDYSSRHHRSASESSDSKPQKFTGSSSSRGMTKLTSQRSRPSHQQQQDDSVAVHNPTSGHTTVSSSSSSNLQSTVAETLDHHGGQPLMAHPGVRPPMWAWPVPGGPFMMGSREPWPPSDMPAGWQKPLSGPVIPPRPFYTCPPQFDQRSANGMVDPFDEQHEPCKPDIDAGDRRVREEESAVNRNKMSRNSTEARKESYSAIDKENRRPVQSSPSADLPDPLDTEMDVMTKQKPKVSSDRDRPQDISGRPRNQPPQRQNSGSWVDEDRDSVEADGRKTGYSELESGYEGSRNQGKTSGGRGLQSHKPDRRRAEPRSNCPPPISLKQSQPNMATFSRFTPLKRGNIGGASATTDSKSPSAAGGPSQSESDTHSAVESKLPSLAAADTDDDAVKLQKVPSKDSLADTRSEVSDTMSFSKFDTHSDSHQTWGDAVEDAEEKSRLAAAGVTVVKELPPAGVVLPDTATTAAEKKRDEDIVRKPPNAPVSGISTSLRSSDDPSRTGDDRPPTKKMRDEGNTYTRGGRRDDGHDRDRLDRSRSSRNNRGGSSGKGDSYRGSGGGRGRMSAAGAPTQTGNASRYGSSQSQGRDGDYRMTGRGVGTGSGGTVEKRGTLTFERSDLQQHSDNKLESQQSSEARKDATAIASRAADVNRTSYNTRTDRNNQEQRNNNRDLQSAPPPLNPWRKIGDRDSDTSRQTDIAAAATPSNESFGGMAVDSDRGGSATVRANAWDQPLHGSSRQKREQVGGMKRLDSAGVLHDVVVSSSSSQLSQQQQREMSDQRGEKTAEVVLGQDSLTQTVLSDVKSVKDKLATEVLQPDSETSNTSTSAGIVDGSSTIGKISQEENAVGEARRRDYGAQGRRAQRRSKRQNWGPPDAAAAPADQYVHQSQQPRSRHRTDRDGIGGLDQVLPGDEEAGEATGGYHGERRRRPRLGPSMRGLHTNLHGEYPISSARIRGRVSRGASGPLPTDHFYNRTSSDNVTDAAAAAVGSSRGYDGEVDQRRDHRRRNWRRGGTSGTQSYGRGAGGRGGRGGLVDDVIGGSMTNTIPVRRGPRTASGTSQQSPKMQSVSTDQNLSDVGNEEWETASESSDVLAHHHRHDVKSPDNLAPISGGGAVFEGSSRRDSKKSFGHQQYSDRNRRDNLSEPRAGGAGGLPGMVTTGRNGSGGGNSQLSLTRTGSGGNMRTGHRGSVSGSSTYRADNGATRNTAVENSAKYKPKSAVEPKEESAASKAANKLEKEKKDAMANIDINNYASVVVIDDQPEVSIDDPSFLFESNEGFQEVTSRRTLKSKQKAAMEEALKKSQEQQLQAKKAEKEAKARQLAEQKRAAQNGKLPPRMAAAGRRGDRKHTRGGVGGANSQLTVASGADDLSSLVAVASADTLNKIENWDNEVLPKIENWNNEMANNIPTSTATSSSTVQPTVAAEPLPSRGVAAAIAIVPATPVGKWENSSIPSASSSATISTVLASPHDTVVTGGSSSGGTGGITVIVPPMVVAAVVLEKAENLHESSVNSGDGLTSAASVIRGSTSTDNSNSSRPRLVPQPPLSAMVGMDTVASGAAVAKQTELLVRQPETLQSVGSAPVEIRLGEIGPFLSDVSPAQMQPKPQPPIEKPIIKPMVKMDENRAVKKPDPASAARPARTCAFEPIELPSNFAFTNYTKGENQPDLKLDFTFDANLAPVTAGDKSEPADTHSEPPPPITMPPGAAAMMLRTTAVVAAAATAITVTGASVMPDMLQLQSPAAADELNMKIMSVKNVWERESQNQTALVQMFEQSLMQQRTAAMLQNVPMTDEMMTAAQQQQQQQMQQQLQHQQQQSFTDYNDFVESVNLASTASDLQQLQQQCQQDVSMDYTSASSATGGCAGMIGGSVSMPSYSTVSGLDQSGGLVYLDADGSYAAMKDSRTLLQEQTNVCKVRPQLQASSSPPTMAQLRGISGMHNLSANTAQLMFAAAGGQNYQYALNASQLLAQDSSGMGLQYGGQAAAPAYGYNISQPATPQATAMLAPLAQNSLFLQGAALPAALQQADLYSAGASTLQAYRSPFGPPPPAQPNTIMVSSSTSSLMSAAIKPPGQHLYLASSGSQKSSQLPTAVQYGQLISGTTLQQAAAQSQLCYQYEAAGQPALATSPVQSEPILAAAAQSSQIIGSQLVQQRATVQTLQPPTNYYSQTPLQQTGFYQAQQAASGLQGSYQQLTAQPYSLSTFGLQAPTINVPVQPIHSQLKLSAPPFKPASQQLKNLTSSASSYTPLTSAGQPSYIQQAAAAVPIYGNLLQQQQLGSTGDGGSMAGTGSNLPYQYYSQQQQAAAASQQATHVQRYYSSQTPQQHLQEQFNLQQLQQQQQQQQQQGQSYQGSQGHQTYQGRNLLTAASTIATTTASSMHSSASAGANAGWQMASASTSSRGVGSATPQGPSVSGGGGVGSGSNLSQYQQQQHSFSADASKSAPGPGAPSKSAPPQIGLQQSAGPTGGSGSSLSGTSHHYMLGSGSGSSASSSNLQHGQGSSASLKELQAAERRKALQQVQSFLNPQNKPPAKSAATISGGSTTAVAASGAKSDEVSSSSGKSSDSRKLKDDK